MASVLAIVIKMEYRYVILTGMDVLAIVKNSTPVLAIATKMGFVLQIVALQK
jgi:hypothetical protein